MVWTGPLACLIFCPPFSSGKGSLLAGWWHIWHSHWFYNMSTGEAGDINWPCRDLNPGPHSPSIWSRWLTNVLPWYCLFRHFFPFSLVYFFLYSSVVSFFLRCLSFFLSFFLSFLNFFFLYFLWHFFLFFFLEYFLSVFSITLLSFFFSFFSLLKRLVSHFD